MEKDHAAVCYLDKFGTIISMHGKIIKSPTVLIDVEEDTLIKWGDYESVYPVFEKYASVMKGISTPALIELSDLLPQDQCYIIRRMVEYTVSGFVRNLGERVGANTKDILDWLHAEMQRNPINCNSKIL